MMQMKCYHDTHMKMKQNYEFIQIDFKQKKDALEMMQRSLLPFLNMSNENIDMSRISTHSRSAIRSSQISEMRNQVFPK